jgi:large subunit ribosomal protein L18
MRTEKKQKIVQRRRWRIRQKIKGTPERPRLSVRFSGHHVYVQFVDDVAGVTLAATSSRSKSLAAERGQLKANVPSAKRLGAAAAEAARAKGITQIVFDRGAHRFHGKVKALADAAREGGLQF